MRLFPGGLARKVLRSQRLGWTESLQAQVFQENQCLKESNLLELSKWP